MNSPTSVCREGTNVMRSRWIATRGIWLTVLLLAACEQSSRGSSPARRATAALEETVLSPSADTYIQRSPGSRVHGHEEILLVRERHFPATIASLYDPGAMPADLRAAHDRNDEVVERIYIGRRFKNDTERLERLFELYAKMNVAAPPVKGRARRGESPDE